MLTPLTFVKQGGLGQQKTTGGRFQPEKSLEVIGEWTILLWNSLDGISLWLIGYMMLYDYNRFFYRTCPPKKKLKIGLTMSQRCPFYPSPRFSAMPSMISIYLQISRLVHHDLPIVMAGCTAGRDDRGLQTWSEASCASEAVGTVGPGHKGSPETTTRGSCWTMRENKNISWDLIRDYMCIIYIYIFI